MSIREGELRTGRCLCGEVSFQTEGPPTIVAHCCCLDCQRLTGAGHSTGAMFPAGRFRLDGVVGEYRLTSDAGNEVTRVFCPACGSPILGRNSGMHGFVTLSLGAFEDTAGLEPQVAIFTRTRRPWDLLGDSVQCFETQPGWRPTGS
jgi:hypothetical protein